jgi:hypothetical protein
MYKPVTRATRDYECAGRRTVAMVSLFTCATRDYGCAERRTITSNVLASTKYSQLLYSVLALLG